MRGGLRGDLHLCDHLRPIQGEESGDAAPVVHHLTGEGVRVSVNPNPKKCGETYKSRRGGNRVVQGRGREYLVITGAEEVPKDIDPLGRAHNSPVLRCQTLRFSGASCVGERARRGIR